MSEALAAGDLPRAGQVMGASHASLRDLYDVSTPELDALVEAAVSAPGCYGARLTGAGFGGCVVAIADVEAGEPVIETVKSAYSARCGREATAIISRAAPGARLTGG
jgi:galactokinase